MKIESDDGITVIEMGTGDTLVTYGILDETDETTGCISFCENGTGNIGEEWETDECKLDTMIGVHTRITFSDTRSIDVVIEMLERAKKAMVKEID